MKIMKYEWPQKPRSTVDDYSPAEIEAMGWAQLARVSGIPEGTIIKRVQRGDSKFEAMTREVRRKRA